MAAESALSERGERRAYAAEEGHIIRPREQHWEARYMDPVSGLHNRRYLSEILGTQLEVAASCQFPIAFVLAEIAHYRQIQYTFGDGLANGVVRGIAETMRNSARATDLVVRYWDDGFAFLLPHCTEHGATRLCDRVRSAIARRVFSSPKSDLRVVVNFGISQQMPEWDLAGRMLQSRAEAALHIASARGDGAIVRAEELYPVVA